MSQAAQDGLETAQDKPEISSPQTSPRRLKMPKTSQDGLEDILICPRHAQDSQDDFFVVSLGGSFLQPRGCFLALPGLLISSSLAWLILAPPWLLLTCSCFFRVLARL